MQLKRLLDRLTGRTPPARPVRAGEEPAAEPRPAGRISVADAALRLEVRGALKRLSEDQSERVIAHVREVLGRELPADLEQFYRERIASIGEYRGCTPVWSEKQGWQDDEELTALLDLDAAPLFRDGCGAYYGLDLTPGARPPAVYSFGSTLDLESAAGSSLGVFLLLLADHDQAVEEDWPALWEETVDPDINACPRAPAGWTTN